MHSSLTLSHDDALKGASAITMELKKRALTAVIAVADSHGELILLHRMDGAPLASILIAMNKAWTAARERKNTWQIGRDVRDPKTGFDIAYYGDRRYLGWGGGVPVLHDGQTVGAVAVSGLTERLDEEMANIGLQAIQA